jgi:hypothetical protein
MLNRTNRTHVEDVKDPDKVLLPSSNLLLITLRENKPDDSIPFTLLDDVPLDPRQGSASEISVSGSLPERMTGPAYTVKSPIALKTDWLSPSSRLPFNFR